MNSIGNYSIKHFLSVPALIIINTLTAAGQHSIKGKVSSKMTYNFYWPDRISIFFDVRHGLGGSTDAQWVVGITPLMETGCTSASGNGSECTTPVWAGGHQAREQLGHRWSRSYLEDHSPKQISRGLLWKKTCRWTILGGGMANETLDGWRCPGEQEREVFFENCGRSLQRAQYVWRQSLKSDDKLQFSSVHFSTHFNGSSCKPSEQQPRVRCGRQNLFGLLLQVFRGQVPFLSHNQQH